ALLAGGGGSSEPSASMSYGRLEPAGLSGRTRVKSCKGGVNLQRDAAQPLGCQTAVSCELVDDAFRRPQIRGREPFAEATVHGRQQVTRLRNVASLSPQSRETRGSTQFPRMGPLLPRDVERSLQHTSPLHLPRRGRLFPVQSVPRATC